MMKKMKRVFQPGLTIFLCAVSLCLSGCQTQKPASPSIQNGHDIAILPTKGSNQNQEEMKQEQSAGQRQSIVLDIDTNSKTCTVQMLDTNEKRVYRYDGSTEIFDRYDAALSLEQLELGEVVDITCTENGKKLARLKESPELWEFKEATGLEIDQENRVIRVANEEYTYTDNLVVVQDGLLVGPDKISSADVVVLKGKEQQLASIQITQGHGVVRLEGSNFFLGGYIEIGSDYVAVIQEDMTIPVAPGTYLMTVTKDDTIGSKEIQVGEKEEIRVNLLEFQKEGLRYGSVQFRISPSGATLKIDGRKTEYAGLVDLSYGRHSVEVRKEGYGTYTQTILVDKVLDEYDITLIPVETESAGDSVDPNGTASSGQVQHSGETEKATEQEAQTTKKSDAEQALREPEVPTIKEPTLPYGTLKEQETTTMDPVQSWMGVLSGLLTQQQ